MLLNKVIDKILHKTNYEFNWTTVISSLFCCFKNFQYKQKQNCSIKNKIFDKGLTKINRELDLSHI